MPKKQKPPGDIKIGKQYAYLDLPSGMDECFFNLELVEVKEVGEDGNIAYIFTVLETDTKVKVDSTINHIMRPFQKFAHIYYYKDLFSLRVAISGKEVTQARVDKLVAKWKAVQQSFLDGNHNGKRVTAKIRDYLNKESESKMQLSWEPLVD
jgi:hypothetical protein